MKAMEPQRWMERIFSKYLFFFNRQSNDFFGQPLKLFDEIFAVVNLVYNHKSSAIESATTVSLAAYSLLAFSAKDKSSFSEIKS